MDKVVIVSDAIGEKALRLVEDHRVHLVHPDSYEYNEFQALVSGDTGFHKIQVLPSWVFCDCLAWREDRYCSHAISAMLLWGEDAS